MDATSTNSSSGSSVARGRSARALVKHATKVTPIPSSHLATRHALPKGCRGRDDPEVNTRPIADTSLRTGGVAPRAASCVSPAPNLWMLSRQTCVGAGQ
jgi:hypothetical protein